MRIRVGLVCLGLLLAPRLSQADHKTTVVSMSPAEAPGTPLYEALLYKQTVSNASASSVDFDLDQLVRDGSGVDLSFRSEHATPGYSVCFQFKYFPAWDGAAATSRYGCFRWFDAVQHDLRILSPAEADRIGNLVIHIYDVVGFPDDWDGDGEPPATLTHEYEEFPFTTSRPAPPTLDVPVEARVPPVSRSVVVQAINAAARGILLCAHPTAKYQSVTVKDVQFSASSASVDFRIDYTCTVIERPCHITLRAGFRGRTFQGVSVLGDTAFTDPDLGLQACRQLVNALLN